MARFDSMERPDKGNKVVVQQSEYDEDSRSGKVKQSLKDMRAKRLAEAEAAKRAILEAVQRQKQIAEDKRKVIVANPTIQGASNKVATGETQPYVMGRSFFAPYLLTQPFYHIYGERGNRMEVGMVLECGFSKQVIRKIKLDDAVLKDFGESVTVPQEGYYNGDNSSYPSYMEIAQDGNAFSQITLLNNKIISNRLNKSVNDITSDDPLEITLSPETKKISVGYVFDRGLYSVASDGLHEALDIQVNFRWSYDGGQTFAAGDSDFQRDVGKIDTFAPRYEWSKTFTLNDYVRLHQNGQSAIVLQMDYQVCSVLQEGDENPFSCNVLFTREECFDKEKSSAPAGIVEDSGLAGLVDCKIVEDRERPFCTILGLCVEAKDTNADYTSLAGDALEIKLGKVGIITQSLARIWDGTEWSAEKFPTRNPAAIALEVMTSDRHLLSRFSDAELDLDSFGAFYEYCEEEGFKYDYVVTKAEKKESIINGILTACNAAMMVDELTGKRKICIDQAKENSVAVYNPQNIISIENSKEFERPLDAVRMKYNNSQNDLYQEDTYLVKRQVNGQDIVLDYYSVIKDISVNGITTFGHIVKFCRRYMAELILRPKLTTIKVAREGAFYSLFDKILIQDDSLKIGTGHSVIRSLSWANHELSTITLDGTVTIESGKYYGVVINAFTSSGAKPLSLKVRGVDGQTGTANVLEVLSTVTDEDDVIPENGEVLSFGELDADGEFSRITTPFTIISIKRDGDGLYTLGLKNYDEALFDDGVIPEYSSNLTEKPSNTVDPIQKDYITQTSLDFVLQEIGSGGIKIENPDTPTNVTAKAEKDGIRLSCNLSTDGLKNSISYLVWTITKNNNVIVHLTSDTKDAFYSFDRSVDLYPEGTTLGQWTVSVHSVNVYDKSSEETTAISVSTTDYGTWLLTKPTIFEPNATDRTIKLQFAQSPRSANLTQYGNIRYQLQISRNGGSQSPYDQDEYKDIVSGDRVWFKPNTHDNPKAGNTVQQPAVYSTGITEQVGDRVVLKFYENFDSENHTLDTYVDYTDVDPRIVEGELPQYCRPEKSDSAVGYIVVSGEQVNVYSYTYEVIEEGNVDNYKDSNGSTSDTPTESDYLVYESSYSQTMPLLGQDIRNAVNTDYLFRIRAFNEANVSEWSDVCSTTALCTGIADFVYSNETAKSSIVEFLSAISANIGVIKQGAFGDIDNQQNYWVLDDLSATEAGTNRDLKKGEFRVGGEKEYFACTPNGDGTFSITLKAGNISLTSSGMDFSSGTYFYDEEKKPLMRLHVLADGMVVETRPDEQTAWETLTNPTVVAKVKMDDVGNLIIANTDSEPEIAYTIADSINYRFKSVATKNLDEDGNNTKGLTATGDVSTLEPKLDKNGFVEGSVSFAASGVTNKSVIVTTADKVRFGEFYVDVDGNSDRTIKAEANSDGTITDYTKWGFPKINSINFVEI